jgi:minor extracellular serine protease Vpr
MVTWNRRGASKKREEPTRLKPLALLPALLLALAAPLRAQVSGYYIVELEGPPALERAPVSKDGRRHASADGLRRVAAEQDALRPALAAHEAEVIESIRHVGNALIVRAGDERAAALGAIAGVRRVHPVREIKLHMDRALGLHQVREGWVRLGGEERAGLGVKIGILDTGIDVTHPAFQDENLETPSGFPITNRAPDIRFTNHKVIVARGYASMYGSNGDARDRVGHGTAVAMCAAGEPVASSEGVVSGVAPRAWLGSYNLSNPANPDSFRGDVVAKAFDDAVADGMDVINLSLGSAFSMRPEDDVFTSMVRRAMDLGIIVVASAGNDGPEPSTIGSKAAPPGVIGVGANVNDRVFGGAAIAGEKTYLAMPGSGPNPASPLAAGVADVEQFDPTGLGCAGFPEGALAGRIAFILRGSCTFEAKLNNAAAAGAVGALIYSHQFSPDAITMSVGSATLPASMMSHRDGLDFKAYLHENPGLELTLRFTREAAPVPANRIAGFSSRGPNTDLTIKPDLIATGSSVFTAEPGGGFTIINGTSFSSPIVAGAAAALRGARPGLTPDQYRSLLINTATPLVYDSGELAGVQEAGGGVLNLDAALASTVAAFPTSISFGAGGNTVIAARTLSLTNLSGEAETFTVFATPHNGGAAPEVSEAMVTIAPGESARLGVRLAAAFESAGPRQGFIEIRGTREGSEIRVPYWYGVTSRSASAIKVVNQSATGRRGALLRAAISLRITDAAGVPIADAAPVIEVIAGEAQVVRVASRDATYPGIFDVDVRLGPEPGANVFLIRSGVVTREVTITGQ